MMKWKLLSSSVQDAIPASLSVRLHPCVLTRVDFAVEKVPELKLTWSDLPCVSGRESARTRPEVDILVMLL